MASLAGRGVGDERRPAAFTPVVEPGGVTEKNGSNRCQPAIEPVRPTPASGKVPRAKADDASNEPGTPEPNESPGPEPKPFRTSLLRADLTRRRSLDHTVPGSPAERRFVQLNDRRASRTVGDHGEEDRACNRRRPLCRRTAISGQWAGLAGSSLAVPGYVGGVAILAVAAAGWAALGRFTREDERACQVS